MKVAFEVFVIPFKLLKCLLLFLMRSYNSKMNLPPIYRIALQDLDMPLKCPPTFSNALSRFKMSFWKCLLMFRIAAPELAINQIRQIEVHDYFFQKFKWHCKNC